ncbi:MAG: iron-sulfur cluster assembly accessory protein [Candidatus Paracaedibacteraceae bacterium]|nr:iron-sulfur cluster assembly accessory protein [Candidatus Paracaedibacteraceae bacterium]
MQPSTKLQISKAAAEQLEKTLSKYPGKFLRITVMPGGCNGFEYNLKLDTELQDDDVKFLPSATATVVVDQISLDLIEGSELDYEADLIGASFKLKNPNAATSCGCGNSFSM